jgi:hypothetical protein
MDGFGALVFICLSAYVYWAPNAGKSTQSPAGILPRGISHLRIPPLDIRSFAQPASPLPLDRGFRSVALITMQGDRVKEDPSAFAAMRRPYGAPGSYWGSQFPTLKRGASKLCASGARRSAPDPSTNRFMRLPCCTAAAKGPRLKPSENCALIHGPEGPCSLRMWIQHPRRCSKGCGKAQSVRALE